MDAWHHLVAALGDAASRLRLRPGAAETALDAAEAALGARLPPEYRAWLRIADGQERGGLTVFPFCAWFSPLDEVVAYRQAELTVGAHDEARQPCVLHPSAPDARRTYCRMPPAERLGVARYEERDPAPVCALALATGQVLEGVDDDHFIVLGQSLSAYFERIARLVERGALVPLVFDNDGSEILATPKGGTGIDVLAEEPEP